MGALWIKNVWSKMTRLKDIEKMTGAMETELKRCLNAIDLTMIGIGATVGSGIYVMTGIGARELAGKPLILTLFWSAS
jgi:amino acid permease